MAKNSGKLTPGLRALRWAFLAVPMSMAMVVYPEWLNLLVMGVSWREFGSSPNDITLTPVYAKWFGIAWFACCSVFVNIRLAGMILGRWQPIATLFGCLLAVSGFVPGDYGYYSALANTDDARVFIAAMIGGALMEIFGLALDFAWERARGRD